MTSQPPHYRPVHYPVTDDIVWCPDCHDNHLPGQHTPHRLVRSLLTSDHCERCLLNWPCPAAIPMLAEPEPDQCPRCLHRGDLVTAEGDVVVYVCSFSDDPDWSVPVEAL